MTLFEKEKELFEVKEILEKQKIEIAVCKSKINLLQMDLDMKIKEL